jgi:predicted permease
VGAADGRWRPNLEKVTMRQAKRENQVYILNIVIGVLVPMALLALLEANISSETKAWLAIVMIIAALYLARR